jgi:hypothetical protein
MNSTRGFRASTFRAVSARYLRYARLRFARVPRVLFCEPHSNFLKKLLYYDEYYYLATFT